jgi:hypothetical protein
MRYCASSRQLVDTTGTHLRRDLELGGVGDDMGRQCQDREPRLRLAKYERLLRVKYTTVGTYAGGTTLNVDVQTRSRAQ